VRKEEVAKRYDIIDDDGLARPGERVDPDDIYVNKESPKDTNTITVNNATVEYRPTPLTYRNKVAGYIDKVSVYQALIPNKQSLTTQLIFYLR
jgi:DNA-directed RNA polymerase III subunit RPC2